MVPAERKPAGTRLLLIYGVPWVVLALLVLFFASTIVVLGVSVLTVLGALIAVPIIAVEFRVSWQKMACEATISDTSVALSGPMETWRLRPEEVKYLGLSGWPLYRPFVKTRDDRTVYISPFIPGGPTTLLHDIKNTCPNASFSETPTPNTNPRP